VGFTRGNAIQRRPDKGKKKKMIKEARNVEAGEGIPKFS
jgi:hypothetical protein